MAIHPYRRKILNLLKITELQRPSIKIWQNIQVYHFQSFTNVINRYSGFRILIGYAGG